MRKNILEFPDKKLVQEEAAAWLIRLDGDDALSPEMRAALHEWLARSPVHRHELRALAGAWRSMNVLTQLNVPLGRADAAGPSGAAQVFRYWRTCFRAGAVCALLACAAVAITSLSGWWPGAGYAKTNGTYVTRIGEQRLTQLADGSVIRLNTNSVVEVDFSEGFRDIRLVRGEAEFAVAKNPERPFRVYARNQRVQAVGTAFIVHVQDDKIDVMVTEGEVMLATRSEAPPVVTEPRTDSVAPPAPASSIAYVETLSALKAGQSARMNLETPAGGTLLSAVDVEVIEEPDDMDRRLSWREGLLVFDGDLLEDVVREVSRYTTVAIEITDPEVRATRIGGQFPVGETDAMFDVLENSFGFTITRLSEDRVLISAAAAQAR